MNMAHLKICRICLRTGVKMYKDDQFQLKLCYEEITALKIYKNDELPHYFCYECAMLLYKFHKFKEKCYKGQKMLQDLLLNGPLTYQAIHKLGGKRLNLLDIITVNDRVKTILINDRQNVFIEREFVNNEYYDNESEVTDDEINGSCKDEDKIDSLNDQSIPHLTLTVNNIINKAITDEFLRSDDNGAVSDSDPIEESNSNNLTKIFIHEKKIVKPEEISAKLEDIDHERSKLIENCTELIQDKTNKTPSDNKGLRKNKKTEKIKKNKEETNYKFTKLQRKSLDPSKWKKISLTDEEALKEFEKRAQDVKYVQATYHCKDCYKFFSKEDIMTRHLKSKHNPSIGPFECHFCHIRYKLKCQLRKHMRSHYTKYQCLVCNLVVAVEETAQMHDETHSDIIRTCIHCGDHFKHLSTFYTHLRTHRSKHVCTLCGQSFVSAVGLSMHRRIRHIDATASDVTHKKSDTEEDNKQDTFCERCQIKFETRHAYAEHLNTSALHVDSESKDDASFPKKKHNNLKFGRMRKRKPTTCHQCGKHFDTQSLCLRHHLKEHPRTSFFPPNDRHICEICGASLAPGSIAMHQNMHTRERLYGCQLCNRQFHTAASLKRHLVTHTGEKPFQCTLCDKRFTQSNSMKLHYRTFHLKQPYPKRIRRKKGEIQEAVPMASEEDSY